MTDTKLVTITSSDQADLEKRVRAFYEDFVSDKITDDDESLILDREVHAKYLRGGLGELPGGESCARWRLRTPSLHTAAQYSH